MFSYWEMPEAQKNRLRRFSFVSPSVCTQFSRACGVQHLELVDFNNVGVYCFVHKGFKGLNIKTALGLMIGMRPAVSAGVPFSKLKTRV